MATTYTPSGTLTITPTFQTVASVDQTGQFLSGMAAITKTFNSTNTTISGYFYGTAVCAAGNWLMAHATDPLQGMGDAAYSPGFTVASSKLKLLIVQNVDSTNTITISRGTSNGLPIFDAADDSITLTAGGVFVYFNNAGTAALTTTSNDKLTIAVGGGTPNAYVLAAYGA